MTLSELKAEEAIAAERFMSFEFNGTSSNIIDLSMALLDLRNIRRVIEMVEIEEWKNKQSLRTGINVDDYIDLSDGEGIFLRKAD